MKTEVSQFTISTRTPPTIEITPDIGAVYIRFSTHPVARTQDASTRTTDIHMDIDAKGRLVGIEALGMENITLSKIEKILHRLPLSNRDIDLRKSRIETPTLVTV